MRILLSLGTLWLLLFSACAPTVSEFKAPPEDLAWEPRPPFLREEKVEIPAEAKALGHFAMGQVLLGRGEFGEALKEYEAAVQADPTNSYLRIRLATLYLRKGDLKGSLKEAEEAVRLEPKGIENRLLLAGLYSAMGADTRAVQEYGEVLRLDPNNQDGLLYAGALYLKLGDYERAQKQIEHLLAADELRLAQHVTHALQAGLLEGPLVP